MRHLLFAVTLLTVAPPLPSAALHAQQTATRPGSSADNPARVSGGVMATLIKKRVDPIYPADAKAKGMGGTVVFAVLVNPHGAIIKRSVLAGPPALRDAATTALDQWSYKPYILNGEPAFVSSNVNINFQLQPAP